MSQEEDQEETKEKALENLKLVEERLKGKKFFGGESLGFLDLAFGWFGYYHSVLRKASNLNLLDEETFPNLCTWNQQFCDIPVIKENWPNEEALIHKFHEMRQAHGK